MNTTPKTRQAVLTATKRINDKIVRHNADSGDTVPMIDRYHNANAQLQAEGYELVTEYSDGVRTYAKTWRKVKDRDLPPVYITVGIAMSAATN